MRKHIANYLSNTDYLLHADMFNINNFPTNAIVINTGLGESNLLNIAGGIASENNTVFIYGVCGFIIHRFEQLKFSCKHFGSKHGKIVIFNAGKYGYENLGIGHKLDDDIQLMSILDITCFQPSSLFDLQLNLDFIDSKKNGFFYIQLGRDIEK
jgi:transketolase C-terminal domain/subunit